MKPYMRSAAMIGVSLWTALGASAQSPKYSNKLAPYVSSPVRVVDRMLELASIKPGETVYDLGSGDGRVLIAAVEKYKARAVGIEISPKLVAEASAHIEKLGLADQAHVIQGDVLKADLSRADVVIIYLVTSLNEKLRPRFEKFLRVGARVISHDYAVPGWKPARVEKTDGRHTHLIYVSGQGLRDACGQGFRHARQELAALPASERA